MTDLKLEKQLSLLHFSILPEVELTIYKNFGKKNSVKLQLSNAGTQSSYFCSPLLVRTVGPYCMYGKQQFEVTKPGIWDGNNLKNRF